MNTVEANRKVSQAPAPKRYSCWVVGIISNYTDYVFAANAVEARQIYANKRGCSVAWVEVRPA